MTVPTPGRPRGGWVDDDDACIAGMPGVSAACCGHWWHSPYVLMVGGEAVYGQEAVDRMRALGGRPPSWGWFRRRLWAAYGGDGWLARKLLAPLDSWRFKRRARVDYAAGAQATFGEGRKGAVGQDDRAQGGG